MVQMNFRLSPAALAKLGKLGNHFTVILFNRKKECMPRQVPIGIQQSLLNFRECGLPAIQSSQRLLLATICLMVWFKMVADGQHNMCLPLIVGRNPFSCHIARQPEVHCLDHQRSLRLLQQSCCHKNKIQLNRQKVTCPNPPCTYQKGSKGNPGQS